MRRLQAAIKQMTKAKGEVDERNGLQISKWPTLIGPFGALARLRACIRAAPRYRKWKHGQGIAFQVASAMTTYVDNRVTKGIQHPSQVEHNSFWEVPRAPVVMTRGYAGRRIHRTKVSREAQEARNRELDERIVAGVTAGLKPVIERLSERAPRTPLSNAKRPPLSPALPKNRSRKRR